MCHGLILYSFTHVLYLASFGLPTHPPSKASLQLGKEIKQNDPRIMIVVIAYLHCVIQGEPVKWFKHVQTRS